ncbi:DnaD domain protein [Clostridium ihumii]|uniref:DnaD domain protein n=1 Tax=Clostridium ihumii TaxID=1470356 RepID=UPI00058EF588|nr:DnaD domain protein [Clostridium ihumii]
MFSISNVNQIYCNELGLSLDDLLILDYLRKGIDNKKFMCKIIDDERYYWINYSDVITFYPILNIKKDTLYRKLKKLCKCDILKHKTLKCGGTYSFYTFGNKFNTIFKNSNEENTNTCSRKTATSNCDSINHKKANFKALLNNMIFSQDKDNFSILDLFSCDTEDNSYDIDFLSNIKDFFTSILGFKSLAKYIFNILNKITSLFYNLSKSKDLDINSINRVNNNNNLNTNNHSLDMDLNYNTSKDLNTDDFENELYSYYNDCGFGSLTKVTKNILDSLCKNYGDETLKNAMTEAVKNNVLNLNYVEGILKNWKNKTQKPTIDNLETKLYKKEKDSFNNFEQRKYDFDQLEKDLLGWS